MQQTIFFLILVFLFSCSNEKENKIGESLSWSKREISLPQNNSLSTGRSYLSVYSDIYDLTDETKHLLTSTVSIRNTSVNDSIFVTKADYFNTHGKLIRSYVDSPVYLTPMETVEIVIHRRDNLGGSGANFIFEWAVKNPKYEPLFEAVMIWTTGNQGISFTTKGKNYPNN
ncbi:DUF3124 domain-containing protein [Maribellus comscasis]|uniref:DUF3124 domain-containing protein n=1 Tax=Maribellus comscasis TaxID=2681766 RepID=A0A6I6JQ95_9BACT|nr:DUF3124 domain-containing protein [Maribellus comscasis]QGY42392.1 DUF3124 domain-containing protein [Maribellus comscasis]